MLGTMDTFGGELVTVRCNLVFIMYTKAVTINHCRGDNRLSRFFRRVTQK